MTTDPHPNYGKCVQIRRRDCALQGGVCRCLASAPVPYKVKGTEVQGLGARAVDDLALDEEQGNG